MKIFHVLLATISLIQCCIALKCWVCRNAKSNKECLSGGAVKTCMENELSCQNEVRTVNGRTLITKQCKQPHACRNNALQNDRPAWLPNQCHKNPQGSVCRCCCFTNKCNYPAKGCIDDLKKVKPRTRTTEAPKVSRSCPDLPHPHNGATKCATRFVNRMRKTLCSFACNQGYKLEGERRSECLVNSREPKFDRPVPTCTEIQCKPEHVDLMNGSVRCSKSNKYGSICRFVCDEGFYRSGEPSTTCKYDGEWSRPAPVCKRIECRPPLHEVRVENGGVVCSDANLVGSQCEYTCGSSFTLIGAQHSVCLSMGESSAFGVWTASPPTCVAIVCGELPAAPSNGEVECSDENRVGSVCEFSCDAGHEMVGASRSLCGVEEAGSGVGMWSDDAPLCNAQVCEPHHEAPQDGAMECSDDNRLDSKCTFVCDASHRMVGSAISVCRPRPGNTTDVGWTAPAPQCLPVRCIPELVAPSNGEIRCTRANLVGSQCRFECHLGFRIVGSDRSVCNDIGNELGFGSWSEEKPRCLPNACEPEMTSPTNGIAMCSDSNSEGSECQFECDAGYELVGSPRVVCASATQGNEQVPGVHWSSEAPHCQRVECPVLEELEHGKMICSAGNRSQSVCDFNCTDSGYVLSAGGAADTTCLSDGQWSNPMPCCSQPCPPYTKMNFVIILDSSSSVGKANWKKMIEFLINLVGEFEVDPNYTRVAAFRYNRVVDTRNQIAFGDVTTADELTKKLETIPYRGFGTMTGNALKYALDTILTNKTSGYRPGVNDVVLVLTDGRSKDDVLDVSVKLRERGAQIFAVGIATSRLNMDQLLQIAGGEERLLIAERGFDSLNEQLLEKIRLQICTETSCSS